MAMMVPVMGNTEANPDLVTFGHQVGRNIKAVMKAAGLNQAQLADRADMPSGELSQLLNGRPNPSLFKVLKVAQVLQVSLDELAGVKPLRIPDPVETDLQVSPANFRSLVAEVKKLARTVRKLEEARQAEPQSRTAPKRTA